VLLLDLPTQQLDTIGITRGSSTYYEALEGRRGVSMYPMPFSPESFVIGGRGIVWIGNSTDPVIVGIRDPAGTPIRITWASEGRNVTRGERDRLREFYREKAPTGSQERWARFARSMDFPDIMPYFGEMKADLLGNIWVQDFEPPWVTGPQRWTVFSPDGTRVASVELPETAVPTCSRGRLYGCGGVGGILEIGDDYLLILQRDGLGVPRVSRFHLARSP
jgi:hypothetical protein